jgi:hypothetical protein
LKADMTSTGEAFIVRGFNRTIEQSEFICWIDHSAFGKLTVRSLPGGLNERTWSGWSHFFVEGFVRAIPGPTCGMNWFCLQLAVDF